MRSLLVIIFAFAAISQAQDTRGQILGTVTDSAGARVPGAVVRVINVNSGVEGSATTNDNGEYLVPFLLPGAYTVIVEHPGFKRVERANINVRISERIPVNVQLEVGAVSETVNVSATASLLEVASASMGQVIDSKRISELPLKDGNPIMLAQLAPGVMNLSTGGWSRPFDVGSPSAIATDGTRTGNTEFTMDGAPNNQRTSVAYIPPADVVQEFRITTANFDAAQGFATGASINVSVKSGTNQLHGTAYHFLQNPVLNANRFFSNAAGLERPVIRLNRWGTSGTGPVLLPKLYDGRNKTFWTYVYEGIHSSDPRGTITTAVPLPQQRLGDFSSLLALGSQYQIYDPATIAPAANGRFSRQPFPNNIIPASRIDPAARQIAEFWDQPNLPGTADGNNNWTTPGPESDRFGSHLFRVDHNFSDANRMFVRGDLNDRELLYDVRFGGAVGGNFQRRNRGIVFDDVHVLSTSMVLNSRYGYNRFLEGNTPVNQGMDLTALGFQQSFVDSIQAAASDGLKLPQIRVTGYGELGGHTHNIRGTDTHEASFSVTHLKGVHSMRYGYAMRVWRENARSLGQSSGRLDFGSDWTRGPLDNSPAAPLGQGLASFLLGLPTAGFIDRNDSYAMQNIGHGLFFQDDWRVSRRLTLSLGIRYELEGAPTERYNRSVQGFDDSVPNPIQEIARENYARNPIPQIPPSAFTTMGGLSFAGNPRQLWSADKNNFMPRFGFAYQATDKTVVRGGYGIYNELIGTSRQQVIQTGFSTATALVPSLDNGQTFVATLADPFPQGIDTGLGAAGGLSTFVGQDITFFNQNLFNPYVQRWQMSVQQQLASDLVVEVGYVGNRGSNLRTTRHVNAVPGEYHSTAPERDQGAIDFLSTNVPNPFYPHLPRTNLASATVPRSQLLRPFPHFTSITMQDNNGYSWYHSMQARVEKRLSRDYTVNLSWTWSKFMEATGYLNQFDTRPERVISDQDRTHRIVASGLWEVPIGRGKRFLGSGFAGTAFGGWQVQAIYQYQSGPALGFGNAIFRGDLKDIPLSRSERTVERWFNVDAGFERAAGRQLASNARTMPTRFSGIRGDGINNWDLSIFKNTQLGETTRLQFRTELINAFNHAQFAEPNTTPTSTAFGAVTAESQWSRTIQFGLKLIF
jgi:Carboxypeptidase regulatory-like domain/TonB dependent receptor